MGRADTAAEPETVFDAIAKLIEPGQREYFFQRMLHFRHLRPDDELLQIAEALGFLALIIRQTPEALARERKQLATELGAGVEVIRATEQASRSYIKHLEERLTKLPPDLVKGLNAGGLVQTLSESVRQQVVQSGLPSTVDALGVVARNINQTVGQLQIAGQQLSACAGTADQARQALGDLSAGLQQATEAARRAMQDISETFRGQYRRSLLLVSSAALLVGVFLGLSAANWRASRTQALFPQPATPTMQTAPAPPPPTTTSRERHPSNPRSQETRSAPRRPK